MRIRTIKPEFFTHEGLFELEQETGLPVRLAFVGLWCAADREGRFRDEPRRLGVSILPYDGVDFSRVLHALTTRGFLVRYRVENAWFYEIPSWRRHQVVNNRERASEIPASSESSEICSRVPDACPTRDPRQKAEGKGREGKGNTIQGGGLTPPVSEESLKLETQEPDPPPAPANRPFRPFTPPNPEEVAAYSASIGYPLDGAAWCDTYAQKGWMVGKTRMKDWRAAVRNWKANRYTLGGGPPATLGRPVTPIPADPFAGKTMI